MRSTYILIDLHNKPKWFWDVNPAGSVPVLDVGDRVIGDSYEIVRFLDKTYPVPPLDVTGNEEAEQVTGDVFNVFSAWAKNTDSSKNAELEANVTAELEKIDEFLGKSSGAFLCGDMWSIADCALLPRLHHITTIAKHYLKYDKFENMTYLSAYMSQAFATDVWKATNYPPEYILTVWAKFFE